MMAAGLYLPALVCIKGRNSVRRAYDKMHFLLFDLVSPFLTLVNDSKV
jgi:hypothetical protein